MTPQEFTICFRELSEFYPQGNFGEQQAEIIFDHVKILSFGQFHGIIVRIFEKYSRAPSLGQIKMECNFELNRARTYRTKSLRSYVGYCKYCHNTGMVSFIEGTAQCGVCETARHLKLQEKIFPIWTPGKYALTPLYINEGKSPLLNYDDWLRHHLERVAKEKG